MRPFRSTSGTWMRTASIPGSSPPLPSADSSVLRFFSPIFNLWLDFTWACFYLLPYVVVYLWGLPSWYLRFFFLFESCCLVSILRWCPLTCRCLHRLGLKSTFMKSKTLDLGKRVDNLWYKLKIFLLLAAWLLSLSLIVALCSNIVGFSFSGFNFFIQCLIFLLNMKMNI